MIFSLCSLLCVSCRQSLHLPDLRVQWSPLRSSLTSSRLLALWRGSIEPLLALNNGVHPHTHTHTHTHTHYLCIVEMLLTIKKLWCFICFVQLFVFMIQTLSSLHSSCLWHSDEGCWTCKLTPKTNWSVHHYRTKLELANIDVWDFKTWSMQNIFLKFELLLLLLSLLLKMLPLFVWSQASVQTVPNELKNKSTLCTPLVHNKGVSCTTRTVDAGAQTGKHHFQDC